VADAKTTPKPPRYITPAGFNKIAAEHREIWTKLRPKIVAEVEAAAALGDRSENAEYIYGKKKLRELDRRLRFLSERMDELTVIDPKPHPTGKAFFGAYVTVEDEDGEEKVYRLVGPDEFEISLGFISVDAPLGRSLLGRAEGETVSVTRPAGTTEVTIVEISYDPPKRSKGGSR
jgi:transcription elongation factor GreB